MLKYIISFLLIFALAACETDETTEVTPEEVTPAQPETQQPVDQSEIAGVTDEELEIFTKVMFRVEQERIGTRTGLREVLAEEGMDMWRFEEIEAASQRDRELRQNHLRMMRELRDSSQD